MHAAVLVYCLLQDYEVQVCELSSVGVFRHVRDVLLEAAEGSTGHPVQMDFARVDAMLCIAEEALAQVALALQDDISDTVDADIGQLSELLPLLATIIVPFAQSKLPPLLDRATACCRHLIDIQHRTTRGMASIHELPVEGMFYLLEALVAMVCWKNVSTQDAALVCTLQRRVLAILTWAVGTGVKAEVRADVAAGVEQLLRDRLITDASVAADARGLLSAAIAPGLD